MKREGSSSALATVPPSKKLKVLPGTRPGISGPSGSSLLSIERLGVGQTGLEPWESLVIECEISEVFETVINHVTNDNTERAVSIINNFVAIIFDGFKYDYFLSSYFLNL